MVHNITTNNSNHVLKMYGFQWGNLKEDEHLQDPDNDDRTILKWILNKYLSRVWTGFIKFRILTSGKPCEHGNKPSGSITCREFD